MKLFCSEKLFFPTSSSLFLFSSLSLILTWNSYSYFSLRRSFFLSLCLSLKSFPFCLLSETISALRHLAQKKWNRVRVHFKKGLSRQTWIKWQFACAQIAPRFAKISSTLVICNYRRHNKYRKFVEWLQVSLSIRWVYVPYKSQTSTTKTSVLGLI